MPRRVSRLLRKRGREWCANAPNPLREAHSAIDNALQQLDLVLVLCDGLAAAPGAVLRDPQLLRAAEAYAHGKLAIGMEELLRIETKQLGSLIIEADGLLADVVETFAANARCIASYRSPGGMRSAPSWHRAAIELIEEYWHTIASAISPNPAGPPQQPPLSGVYTPTPGTLSQIRTHLEQELARASRFALPVTAGHQSSDPGAHAGGMTEVTEREAAFGIDVRTTPPQVTICGDSYSLNANQADLLRGLVAAKGEWISATELVDQPTRVINGLPEVVQERIERVPGKGTRLRPPQ